MSSIKYSVIIPLYNKEPHIGRALQSVLNQTYQDFEIIVIDDASTDGGLSVVKSFTDKRIRIIKVEADSPGGVSKARNMGIAAASSCWVSFLDADDEWKDNYLDKINQLQIEFSGASMLSSGWINFFDKDNVTENEYYISNKSRGDHLYEYKEFLENSIKNCRPVWTSVATIRRSVIVEAGGFPESGQMLAEDLDTWLRTMKNSGNAAWSASIGAVYYRDSQNMVTKNTVPKLKNSHLVSSINRFLETEDSRDIKVLLKKYRRAVRLALIKDILENKFIKLCTLLLGNKNSKRFVSSIVKCKKQRLYSDR